MQVERNRDNKNHTPIPHTLIEQHVTPYKKLSKIK